MEKIS